MRVFPTWIRADRCVLQNFNKNIEQSEGRPHFITTSSQEHSEVGERHHSNAFCFIGTTLYRLKLRSVQTLIHGMANIRFTNAAREYVNEKHSNVQETPRTRLNVCDIKILRFSGRDFTWNACDCCPFAVPRRTDDGGRAMSVHFLRPPPLSPPYRAVNRKQTKLVKLCSRRCEGLRLRVMLTDNRFHDADVASA
ncbi:hypothetical protein ANN_23837 [Periplaneta americana]|uniref:Uncharacterized protein n=1 Tax=Periplaneta americana TaxID=6978 RepID=A0ABQ8SN47_PERAM|nr:hypothetical protein ANN_23837 [Periplaneta americana]